MSAPRSRFWLICLLALTLLLRGSVLWVMRDNLRQDPDAYRQIAENLLRFGEFAMGQRDMGEVSSRSTPTAYRPPLYPILLSNLPDASGLSVSLFKVAVLHVLLGLATVWLTYLTALKVGPSRREGPASCPTSPAAPVAQGLSDPLCPLLAGFLVACDPILLNQQTLVMTETLATFLA